MLDNCILPLQHRKIINPAFNLEQLKTLVPVVSQSCNDVMDKWDSMLSPTDGTCEVEVSPRLKNLTKEVIARAAFGSIATKKADKYLIF
ncbi:hypothetical protein K1719_034573 [Acacia pycnantha]|nr:hypothetical protein K1719_034573 [Acacia pycnantha]